MKKTLKQAIIDFKKYQLTKPQKKKIKGGTDDGTSNTGAKIDELF